mgnify:CR=1 FL=1
MRHQRPTPTGRLVTFGTDDIIVSKTDLTGRITYANDIFEEVSGYREDELIGAQHSIVRHPQMPRAVFKLLWDTIGAKREIFAYVLNMARTGDGYWVFAHVTPSFDLAGAHVGYHSNRRVPHADALAKIAPLYEALAAEERRHADRQAGLVASTRMLVAQLESAGVDYEQFVFSLSTHTSLAGAAA